MSSPWSRAAVALGALGAVAGAVFAGERFAAARLRRAPDADRDHEIVPAYEHSWRLPAHDGGEIHVVEAGQGPPILLSHGVTLSIRTWSKQLRSLADAGFRVIAFDHRGHGASTAGHEGHGVAQIASDLRSVLEGLDLHDCVVVGHSMGGIAAQAFCIDHPEVARERVAGLVLLSTLARSPFAANPRVAALWMWIADHAPDGSGVLRPRDLGLMIARLGFGRNPAPSHVELTRQMILETGTATRRDAVKSLAGLDLLPRLGEIDRPTLVIGGTADLIAPIAESRRIARRIPGATIEEITGGGHMLMLEKSELFDRLVVEFARSVQSTTPATGSASG